MNRSKSPVVTEFEYMEPLCKSSNRAERRSSLSLLGRKRLQWSGAHGSRGTTVLRRWNIRGVHTRRDSGASSPWHSSAVGTPAPRGQRRRPLNSLRELRRGSLCARPIRALRRERLQERRSGLVPQSEAQGRRPLPASSDKGTCSLSSMPLLENPGLLCNNLFHGASTEIAFPVYSTVLSGLATSAAEAPCPADTQTILI